MGILFGQQKRQAFPEPIVPAYPGAPNDYAHSSSMESSLRVPTVWACAMLVANTVSMLPMETFTTTSKGLPKRVPDPTFVRTPNEFMRQAEWLHQIMLSLVFRGNAYGVVNDWNTSDQTPKSVLMVHPDMVQIKITDGAVTYLVGPTRRELQPYNGGKSGQPEVWHVRGYTLPGVVAGLSPLAYAAQTIALDDKARQFATDFFNGSNIPKAIVTTAAQLDQAQARTAKDRIIAATTSREPLILGGDWKYQALTVAPNEAQFLETMKLNVSQIARFFSVPPEMVGGEAGGSMTYANVEQRSIDFLTYCIAPWLRRLEDAMYTLMPGKKYLRFDTEELIRTDAETRAKIAVQHVAAKIRTPTEIRAAYGLPPMTAAQKAEVDMVPLAPTPMGGAKAEPGITDPGGNPAPTPTDEEQPDSEGEAA